MSVAVRNVTLLSVDKEVLTQHCMHDTFAILDSTKARGESCSMGVHRTPLEGADSAKATNINLIVSSNANAVRQEPQADAFDVLYEQRMPAQCLSATWIMMRDFSLLSVSFENVINLLMGEILRLRIVKLDSARKYSLHRTRIIVLCIVDEQKALSFQTIEQSLDGGALAVTIVAVAKQRVSDFSVMFVMWLRNLWRLQVIYPASLSNAAPLPHFLVPFCPHWPLVKQCFTDFYNLYLANQLATDRHRPMELLLTSIQDKEEYLSKVTELHTGKNPAFISLLGGKVLTLIDGSGKRYNIKVLQNPGERAELGLYQVKGKTEDTEIAEVDQFGRPIASNTSQFKDIKVSGKPTSLSGSSRTSGNNTPQPKRLRIERAFVSRQYEAYLELGASASTPPRRNNTFNNELLQINNLQSHNAGDDVEGVALIELLLDSVSEPQERVDCRDITFRGPNWLPPFPNDSKTYDSSPSTKKRFNNKKKFGSGMGMVEF